MSNNSFLSADETYEMIMNEVAPLPCQQEYAKQLSAIISYHYKKNKLIDLGISADSIPYQGAIIIGPSGQGKTHLLRAAAKVLDVNVICLDGSTISRDGWKGASLGQQLLGSKKALGNDEKWECSILFIDEFDKLRLYHAGHDESNAQQNILQLYNQGPLAVETPDRSVEFLNIERFTILLAGAFEGIESIIKERVSPKRSMGFADKKALPELTKADYIKQTTSQDLQDYGFMPEILGRISSIITIDPMTAEDYKYLVSSSRGSLSYKYKTYFNHAYGIDFSVDDKAAVYIAQKCVGSITGARAATPIVNDIMREAILAVDMDSTVNKVILSANDEGCFLDYTHGERVDCLLNSPITNKSKTYLLKGKNADEIANKLVEVYKEIQPNSPALNELKAFLDVSLYFIMHCCPENDLTFNSLEEMVKCVFKEENRPKSPLDIMIDKAHCDSESKEVLLDYYKSFMKCYDNNTCSRLTKALGYIHNAIKKEHNGAKVDFKIECMS